MAGFNNRGHDPMYSHVAGLNGIPSDYELALQQQQAGQYDFQADLDMFTNTQFFDFDMAEMPETASPHGSSSDGESWNLQNKFIDQSQQSRLPNFNYHSQSRPLTGTTSRRPNFPASQTTHSYAATQNTTISTTASPPSAISSPVTSDPRSKSESAPMTTSTEALDGLPQSLEEASRAAAEEDKRRRNTAASARFRVKKKQREQALEKSAKDMTDRLAYLENRVQTLEMENKLLKDLITEKKGTDVEVLKGVVEGDKRRQEAESQSEGAEVGRRKGLKVETR